MTREELAAAFSGAPETMLPAARARQVLMEDRTEVQAEGKDWFWIGIQPARDVALDVQRPDLPGLLTDREAIGVLAGAPSFHVSFEPELKQGRLVYYSSSTVSALSERTNAHFTGVWAACVLKKSSILVPTRG